MLLKTINFHHRGQDSSQASNTLTNPYADSNTRRDYRTPPDCTKYQTREKYYISHKTESDKKIDEDYLPEGTMIIRTMNGKEVSLFGLALFDSGSTSTLINERAIPHAISAHHGEDQMVTTTQGTYLSKKYFDAKFVSFPEFCKTRHIQ